MSASSVVSRARIGALTAYTVVLIGAEIIGAVRGAPAAAIVDGLMAAIAIGQAMRTTDPALRRLVAVLALIALSRTLSVVLPYRGLPPLAWNAAVSATVLAGAALGTRLFDDPVRHANLRLRRPRVDVLLAGLGLPLGLLGSVVLHPSPLVQGGGAGAIVAEVVVLLGLAALAEELLFRGLLLTASRDVLTSNREATLYGAGVAAALYLGTASLGYIALMALAAAGLAEARWRGASLWGLTACRGAALVVMALLAR